MLHLLAASVLWAFSFGLIKTQLAELDPVLVSCGRLALAAAAFVPFLARVPLPRRSLAQVMGLGMIQFGLMYVLYITSYRWLPAWMVALFTIFTPFYVVGIADLIDRTFNPRHLLAAALAVTGAWVILAEGLPAGADWRGILLLQGANLCFALGQVLFPRLQRAAGGHEAGLLAWMYQGAALLTLVAVLIRRPPAGDWDVEALLVLVYLGLVPTALGFYLWNKGAARTGAASLGVANNLKIPLAVLVSWLVFHEDAAYGRALGGMALIMAGLLAARPRGAVPAVAAPVAAQVATPPATVGPVGSVGPDLGPVESDPGH